LISVFQADSISGAANSSTLPISFSAEAIRITGGHFRTFFSVLCNRHVANLRHDLAFANCPWIRQSAPEYAYKKVSDQERERLVPVKRRATAKTRGGGRPRPNLGPAVGPLFDFISAFFDSNVEARGFLTFNGS